MRTAAADVVVVGAGVIGAFCARELARGDARVIVIERGGGWGEACSWGNAGLIVPSHARPIAAPEALSAGLRWMLRSDAPFGLRLRPSLAPWLVRYARAATPRRAAAGEALQRELALESLRLFADDRELDLGVRRDGCLNAYTGRHGTAHAAADAASPAGRALGARLLDGEQTRALEPALSSLVTAGVLFPGEGHVDPVRLTRVVGAAATAAGAELLTGMPALGLRCEGSIAAVETPAGTLRARHVVVAAGAWSGALARSAGVRLPLQGGKGYAIELPRPALPLRRPVYMHEERCVATPFDDRTRMTGGLILDGLDERFDVRRVTAIRRAAERGFGAGRVEPVRTWHGLRPCTPDGLPAIGTVRTAPGLILATGHAMLGVTLAPVTARIVADLVEGRAQHPALARLSPERFT